MLEAYAGMASPPLPEDDSEFVAQLTGSQLPLLLYVRSLLPGEAAARDVAQQVNARIWENRGDFQMGTNFKAWAFSIARFEVLNFRKQQAREARLVFSSELEQVMASELAEAPDDTAHRHDALRECLQTLRAQDRALLLHRYGQAETLASFAESAGRSLGGVKVTLHRLRSALLICIERRLRAGEASL